MIWSRRVHRGSIEAAHLTHPDRRPANDCHFANLPLGVRSGMANTQGIKALRLPLTPVPLDALNAEGLPYGKVCIWCLRHQQLTDRVAR